MHTHTHAHTQHLLHMLERNFFATLLLLVCAYVCLCVGIDDAKNTARLCYRMVCDGCLMTITKSIAKTPVRMLGSHNYWRLVGAVYLQIGSKGVEFTEGGGTISSDKIAVEIWRKSSWSWARNSQENRPFLTASGVGTRSPIHTYIHCCFIRKDLECALQQMPGTQSQLGGLVGQTWKGTDWMYSDNWCSSTYYSNAFLALITLH